MSGENAAQMRAQTSVLHRICITFFWKLCLKFKVRLNAVVAHMRVNTVDCGNVSLIRLKNEGLKEDRISIFKIQCNSRYRKQNSEPSNNSKHIANEILNFHKTCVRLNLSRLMQKIFQRFNHLLLHSKS